MKHDIHCYVVVRVCVQDVEAESQQDAIKKADEYLGPMLGGLFTQTCPRDPKLKSIEYAEDSAGYLVDEAGDTEYLKSQFYNKNGEPSKPDCCEACNQPMPKVGA
jgi:hypothetical protein